MRVPRLVEDLDVVQSNIQEPSFTLQVRVTRGGGLGADLLVDRLEGAGDGEVVLELDSDNVTKSLVQQLWGYTECAAHRMQKLTREDRSQS